MELQTRFGGGKRSVDWKWAFYIALVFSVGSIGTKSTFAQDSQVQALARKAPRSEIQSGFKALDDDHYSEAITHFDRVLKHSPDNVSALYGRGWSRSCNGQWSSAIEDYSHAIKLQPQNAELFRGRALAHYGAGDYNGLVADMEIAAKLNPDYQVDLDDARSTRNFSLVKWFFAALGGVLMVIGVILVARLARLLKGATSSLISS